MHVNVAGLCLPLPKSMSVYIIYWIMPGLDISRIRQNPAVSSETLH